MDYQKKELQKEINKGWVLSNEQIKFLDRYPLFYNAWAGSYLELLFLQKFWIYLSKFIPKFVAPSALTFLGLFFNLVGCSTILYYSPDLKNNDLPKFVPLLLALSTFVYQTLDALDGKQAYKVQNTAIEELSDHGCDAISSVFVTLSIAALMQLGTNSLLLTTFFIISLTAFFFTHYVSHITHCMVFGKIDVSEAQCVSIFGFLLSFFFGQKIWLYPLIENNYFKLTLGHFLIHLTIWFLCYSISQNIQISLMGKLTPIEEIGIKIPRKKINESTYNPLIAISFLIICCYVNYFYELIKLNTLVFLFIYGLSYAKIIITLVLVNVSRGKFEKLNTSLIAPCLLTINCLMSSFYKDFYIDFYTALLCSLVWTTMDCLRYFTYAFWDIKFALDANIFTIKYPVGHLKNRCKSLGFYLNGFNKDQVIEEWKKFEKEEDENLKKIFFH